MQHSTNSINRRRAFTGLLTAAFGLFSAQTAAAYPYGQVRRVSRRTSRRTMRRVARRHFYTMPHGCVPFRWGAYNYYRLGSIFYYPYMLHGRTIYVEVDVDSSGRPLAPPPASQIDVDIDID